LEVTGIKGGSYATGLYLSHPLVKQRGLSVGLRWGLDYRNFHQYINGDQENLTDDIRSSSLGITCDWADAFSGVNYFGLTYTQGLNSLLGGSERNDPFVSRPGGNVDFAKFTTDFVRMQKLPGYNHLMLKASGQYSADELSGPEQYGIGGMGRVRGFKASEKSGDMGYALTAELSLSPFFANQEIFNQKVGDTIKFVLFGDYGKVKWNADPVGGSAPELKSIGAGVGSILGRSFPSGWITPCPLWTASLKAVTARA
jgi:hemolysin activation/secretion protein